MNLDKFYTKPNLIENLFKQIPQGDCYLEPSAGEGAFSDYATKLGVCLAYDILPGKTGMTQADFLKTDITDALAGYKNVVCIGNPPFGRQASLAVKFFNKCASYPQIQSICMIFPKSFKKVSVQNRLNLSFHLVSQQGMGDTAFLYEGKPYDVPTVFQVWERRSKKREKITTEALTPPLSYTRTPKKGDISIRRVGYYAGKANTYQNQSKQSHYFITGSKDADSLIEYLNGIEWGYDDTVGPRSISKQQLNPILNKT